MMTKTDEQNPDSVTQVLHLSLLLLCGAMIAVRCHINETFPTRWRISGPADDIILSSAETPAMLIIAGIIFSMTLLWFLNQCRCKIFSWRKTALLLPALLLLLAGILSTCAASNKHTAIIGVINLTAALTLALLLIQLLDARWKIHLLLAVLTATGVTLAYRCWEQKTYDAPATTQNVLEHFDDALARQGIEPGTYAARQFKDRLLSQDIGGFFAISNTAASFFILSIFATLALVNEKRNEAAQAKKSFLWFFGFLLVAPQLYGLAITQSKGGLIAFFAALLLAALLYLARNFLSQHWKASFVIALLLVILAATAVIGHGLYHGSLPSNSMWLRWQYWQGGFAMITDHPLTGVGAENFGLYYPRYMNPAAPEVVKDPHNVWVALLTQWGPLGLLAFLWAAVSLCRKVITPRPDSLQSPNTFQPKILHTILIAVPVIMLILLARFLTSRGLETLSYFEKQSIVLIAFIVPAIVWTIAFLLALTSKQQGAKDPSSSSVLTTIFLGSALLGFLLHNSIDFAIFHPALAAAFFALVAACFSSRQIYCTNTTICKGVSRDQRWLVSILIIVLVAFFWIFTFNRCRAYQSLQNTQKLATQADIYLQPSNPLVRPNPQEAIRYLEMARSPAVLASHLDSLNPDGPELQAKIAFRLWQIKSEKEPKKLLNAINKFAQASRRDPENYSYYHRTSHIFQILVDQFDQQEALAKALEAARQAYRRNPVKPEVLIDYAGLLDKTGQREAARDIYRRVLDNEQAFQNQQKQMYPHRTERPSRLLPSLKQQAQQALDESPPTSPISGP